MGDTNAVDIAQTRHEAVLRRCGGLAQENVLRYGYSVPSSKNWDGLYIDDRILVAVVPHTTRNLGEPDIKKIMDARAEYTRASLERAPTKAFLNEGKFTAWGTEVNGLAA